MNVMDVLSKVQVFNSLLACGMKHVNHLNVSPNLFPPWFSINRLREAVSTEHTSQRKKEQDTEPKASDGYGGKFGVQQDRMDKVRGSQRQDSNGC